MTTKTKKSIAKAFAAAALTATLSAPALASDKMIDFAYKTNSKYSGLVNCDLLQKKVDPYPSQSTCSFYVDVDDLYSGVKYTCPAGVEDYSAKAVQGVLAHRRDAHGVAAFQSINYDANILLQNGYSGQDALSIIEKTTTRDKMETYYLGRFVDHFQKQGLNNDQIHEKITEVKEKQGWRIQLNRLNDGSYRALYDPGEDARQQCLATYPELRP